MADGIVVEELVVEVDPDDHEAFCEADARIWTAFLSRQDGFIRKETWIDDADPGRLHLMIWWESREQWKRITPDQVAEIDAAMGPWYRDPVVREYRVR